MHSHPNLVAVFQSDSKMKFWFPDGKSQDVTTKAGEAAYYPAGTHLPENTGDKALDGILVELKGKPAAKATAKPAAKTDAMKK